MVGNDSLAHTPSLPISSASTPPLRSLGHMVLPSPSQYFHQKEKREKGFLPPSLALPEEAEAAVAAFGSLSLWRSLPRLQRRRRSWKKPSSSSSSFWRWDAACREEGPPSPPFGAVVHDDDAASPVIRERSIMWGDVFWLLFCIVGRRTSSFCWHWEFEEYVGEFWCLLLRY